MESRNLLLGFLELGSCLHRGNHSQLERGEVDSLFLLNSQHTPFPLFYFQAADGQGRFGKHKLEETQIHTSGHDVTRKYEQTGRCPWSFCPLSHILALFVPLQLRVTQLRQSNRGTTWKHWHARNHLLFVSCCSVLLSLVSYAPPRPITPTPL